MDPLRLTALINKIPINLDIAESILEKNKILFPKTIILLKRGAFKETINLTLDLIKSEIIKIKKKNQTNSSIIQKNLICKENLIKICFLMENLSFSVIKLEEMNFFLQSFNNLLLIILEKGICISVKNIFKQMIIFYFGLCFEKLKDTIFSSIE